MKNTGKIFLVSSFFLAAVGFASPGEATDFNLLPSPGIQGQTGVIRVISATTPKFGTFSLGANLIYWNSDYFPEERSEFFEPGLQQKKFQGTYHLTLSLSDWMEIFFATKTSVTEFSRESATGDSLAHNIGDSVTGFKIGYDPESPLSTGLAFYAKFYSDYGNAGWVWDATTYGGKILFTFDWTRLQGVPLPLRWHLNVGFQLTNAMTIHDDGRIPNPTPGIYYALGLEEDDALLISSALEVPQRYLSIFVEYSTEQYVDTGPEGGWRQFNQNPQRITPGFRITPVGGLAVDIACDLGMGLFGVEERYFSYAEELPAGISDLTATSAIRQRIPEEVAPDWAVVGGFSYAFTPAPPPVVVAPKPEKGKITGRVYDKETSQPLEGAVIAFPGTNMTRLYSGSSGEYTTYEFLPQNVTLKVEKEGYEEASATVIVEAGGTATQDFGLNRLEKVGVLAGKVLEKEGKPLAAVISFDDPKVPNLATDPNTGQYEGKVPPGNYRIRASSTGFKSEIKGARVEDKRRTVVDFVLEPEAPEAPEEGTILGTVQSPESQPLAAVISFGDPRIENVASDPTTGQYKRALPPGSYQVTANAQNYKPQVKIARIEKGLPTLVNFVLEPEVKKVEEGALAGRVVDPEKQPLAGVISFEGAEIPNVVASPATGEFYLKLTPGSYSVRAAAQGYKSQLKVVQIAAGKKTIAEFVLEPLTKAKLTEKKIEILETIHFESGKASILPESFGLLDEVADILMSNPGLSILIEGHTDSVGSDAFNLRLSQSRANSVLQYLTKRGVVPDRLKAVGYGETRPIADNSTPSGRAKNRRVEFTIIRK